MVQFLVHKSADQLYPRQLNPEIHWCSGDWRSGFTLNLGPQCFLKQPVQQWLSAFLDRDML